MINTPEELLKSWMDCINAYDIERLVRFYDDKAILIPTFSNHVLNTPEKIRKYFETLGSREDLSIALHQKTMSVQAIRPQLFSISGIYCWRFAIDGELLNFEARFTFLIDLALPNPIIHHHTSQLPRTL
ncbi:MAG: ketosteroid isomerase family protein [Holophaga sp.]|nr:ketosteroid isomerase family protein [Holophaga sp.]